MIGLPNPWMLLAVAAICAGIGWRGYHMGYRAAQHDHNVERLAMIEAGEKLERARRDAVIKLNELADKLEAEGNAEAATVPECLGPSRVRRLNATR